MRFLENLKGELSFKKEFALHKIHCRVVKNQQVYILSFTIE